MGDIAQENYQMVVFFEGAQINRQMLIEEFESLLDGFVPLVDYSGRRCQCAFLVINSELSLDAAVFFHLEFDASGRPDQHWNTPIKQLATQAGANHILSSNVRIASYSNCSIAWHQQKLWEPYAEQLASLQHCVQDNALQLGKLKRQQNLTSEIPALRVHEGEAPVVLTQLAHHAQDAIDEPVLAKQRRAFEQQINLHLLEIKKLRSRNDELEMQVNGLQRRFEKTLFDRVENAIEKRVLQWQDKLRQAKLYILQQAKRIQQLEQALAESKTDKSSLPGAGISLQQLQDHGVDLQVDQPGIGKVHIPHEDIIDYLAAPMVYIASRCEVPVDTYAAWLAHRKAPTCQAFDHAGKPCQQPVAMVSELADFIPNHSDYCAVHQSSLSSNTAHQ